MLAISMSQQVSQSLPTCLTPTPPCPHTGGPPRRGKGVGAGYIHVPTGQPESAYLPNPHPTMSPYRRPTTKKQKSGCWPYPCPNRSARVCPLTNETSTKRPWYHRTTMPSAKHASSPVSTTSSSTISSTSSSTSSSTISSTSSSTNSSTSVILFVLLVAVLLAVLLVVLVLVLIAVLVAARSIVILLVIWLN